MKKRKLKEADPVPREAPLNNESVELFRWSEFTYEELEREKHGEEGSAAARGMRSGDDVIDDYLFNLPGKSGAETGLDGDGHLIFETQADVGEDSMRRQEVMMMSQPPMNVGPLQAQAYPSTYAIQNNMMMTNDNDPPHAYDSELMNTAVPAVDVFPANPANAGAPSSHHMATGELCQQRHAGASLLSSTPYIQGLRPGTPSQMGRARFEARSYDGAAGMFAFRPQTTTVMGPTMSVSQAEGGKIWRTANANVQPAQRSAKPEKNKSRLRWTPELHKKFVDVVNMLGGPTNTTPKNVLIMMETDGLTILQVKSHLQKYRFSYMMEKHKQGTNDPIMSFDVSARTADENAAASTLPSTIFVAKRERDSAGAVGGPASDSRAVVGSAADVMSSPSSAYEPRTNTTDANPSASLAMKALYVPEVSLGSPAHSTTTYEVELRKHREMQKKLAIQLQAQRDLQAHIEEHGKYLQQLHEYHKLNQKFFPGETDVIHVQPATTTAAAAAEDAKEEEGRQFVGEYGKREEA